MQQLLKENEAREPWANIRERGAIQGSHLGGESDIECTRDFQCQYIFPGQCPFVFSFLVVLGERTDRSVRDKSNL